MVNKIDLIKDILTCISNDNSIIIVKVGKKDCLTDYSTHSRLRRLSKQELLNVLIKIENKDYTVQDINKKYVRV